MLTTDSSVSARAGHTDGEQVFHLDASIKVLGDVGAAASVLFHVGNVLCAAGANGCHTDEQHG